MTVTTTNLPIPWYAARKPKTTSGTELPTKCVQEKWTKHESTMFGRLLASRGRSPNTVTSRWWSMLSTIWRTRHTVRTPITTASSFRAVVESSASSPVPSILCTIAHRRLGAKTRRPLDTPSADSHARLGSTGGMPEAPPTGDLRRGSRGGRRAASARNGCGVPGVEASTIRADPADSIRT